MRLIWRTFALSLGLLALAAGYAHAASPTPKTGFYVFKDLRGSGVIEFRDTTGKVVTREVVAAVHAEGQSACSDSHHTFVGARWVPAPTWPAYKVNEGSTPAELAPSAATSVLNSSQNAWESPFLTDCASVPGTTPFQAVFAGTTTLGPSLAVNLSFDGVNTVAFRPLSGTVCAGPGVVACVVAYSKSGRFVEADLAFESDLSVLGGPYEWTTGDTTAGNKIALADVATHEWGHFAGLGHVKHSPQLTMFPAIRDGMQTLGLGDMKGMDARY
jgi:hypothetical protein